MVRILFSFLLAITTITVMTAYAYAELSHAQVIGNWQGTARYHKEQTRIHLEFTRHDGRLSGRVSLLDIGVSGWPVTKVDIQGEHIHATLPSDSGLQLLKLTMNDDQLTGTWSEPNFVEPARIQMKRIPKPKVVIEQRMLLEGPAGKLGASVILPDGDGPFPAVVFLHGSGPQPRDASRFAAETFARHGIASLIYDKRGVGQSEGNFAEASFEDLAADANVAARYMSAHPQISAVGFWGHSQGGWLAPLAAARWHKAAFVITSAGPAVSPAREGEWGFIAPILRTDNAKDVAPIIREIVASWHQGLRSDTWEAFNRLAATHQQSSWYELTGLSSLNDHPEQNFARNYKKIMDYQPIPTLKSLSIPILAIFANQDESIDSAESITVLQTLQKTVKDLRIKQYEGFNHSMRKIGSHNHPLRFPNHPEDYFELQAAFVLSASAITVGK